MSVRQHDIPPHPRGDGAETPAAPRGSVRSIVLTALGLLLVAAALVVAAYPFVSSNWGAYRANQQFAKERETASRYDEETVEDAIARAEAYNAVLAGKGDASEPVPYEEQLSVEGDRVLCWLDIPSLDIKMPVFHDDGTDEVPVEGAEHVRGTSLPVGGMPSNTVITAHSGAQGGTPMPFNKLDRLQPGDTVILWTLGRPFAYAVEGLEQVDPADVGGLHAKAEIEELTLITCRPIGTTARRLLVHASRTDYTPPDEGSVRVERLAQPDAAFFFAALALAGIVLWILPLLALRRKCVWYLNRGIGSCGFSESELAAFEADEGTVLALELSSFGRARLNLGEGKRRGSWKRVRNDRSRIELDFSRDRSSAGRMVLPDAPFIAQSLDDELSFSVNADTTKLVFARQKPNKQNNPRMVPNE